MSAADDRYRRQRRFLGDEAQERLGRGHVVIVGCGALGGASAPQLARAGVGRLTLIDRDFIEPHNLQRQDLFDEDDLRADLPKAEAAARRLRRVNSTIAITGVVADLTSANIDRLLAGADAVLDGTDNFPTRYLVNDWCVRSGVPWVFAGVVACRGQVMTIVPGRSACLRCLLDAPPAAAAETCETAGILAPAVHVAAGVQVAEAIKLLTHQHDRLRQGLLYFDVWDNHLREVRGVPRRPDCRCCGRGLYDYLDAPPADRLTRLCGRDAVQVTPAAPWPAGAFARAAERLREAGTVEANPFLLRFAGDGVRLTLFPDGRAVFGGLQDLTEARSLYARYLGG